MTPRQQLEQALPLTIGRVEIDDPVFTLIGDGWALSLLCDWTISEDGRSTSSDDPDRAARFSDLVGHQLISVTADDETIDPVFGLTGGLALAIHADSDVDPWSMHLPGLVLVGRMAPIQ